MGPPPSLSTSGRRPVVEPNKRTATGPRVGLPPGQTSADNPQTFGPYHCSHVIAEGGMGVVVAARHEVIGRTVALKIVNPRYAAKEGYKQELIDQFLHEARVLGAIDHAHVVTLYDAGVIGQCPFLALRYVDGGDLSSHVGRHGPLHGPQALRLMAHCAAALRAVHAAGWVSRDLKPGNILLGKDLNPYLVDFGLAVPKGSQPPADVIAGTPAFMAPEQITGEVLDERTDLYALGATIHFTLTGQDPYSGATPEEVVVAVRDALNPPALPLALHESEPHLCTILEKALSPQPDRRYKDALELVHDCESVLAGGEPEYALIGARSKRRKSFIGAIFDRKTP
jgi:serine/threonine protein kinase